MVKNTKGFVYKPVITRKVNGKRVKQRSAFYWCQYKGEDSKPVRHALKLSNGDGITDKEVARAELQKIITRLERQLAGLIDPEVESASQPMRAIVASYLRHLRRRAGIDDQTGLRRSRDYVLQAKRYINWFIVNARIDRLGDFNENNIEKGMGLLVDKGRSPRTVNVYREHLHAFGQWCVKKARMIHRNPVSSIEKQDAQGDIRRKRRALTVDEAHRLLQKAGSRRLLYAFQLLTGLRVNETRQLEWRDVHLSGSTPFLRLRTKTTKSRRSKKDIHADEVALNRGLADALVATKPADAQATDPVFQNVPRLNTFKNDLAKAGIPFRDEHGRQVDRHALRTTFISWLGAAGVDPRVAQMLARHSHIELTTEVYQDKSLLAPGFHAAVQGLPDLLNN